MKRICTDFQKAEVYAIDRADVAEIADDLGRGDDHRALLQGDGKLWIAPTGD